MRRIKGDFTSRNEATILFSGGVDSTMASILVAQDFEKMTLLTYKGMIGVILYGFSKHHVKVLQKRFGKDRIVHKFINICDLWKKIVLDDVEKDYEKYRSDMVWCIGCKMTMHTRTIIYNLEHGITTTFDGSIREQNYYVDQLPESVEQIKNYYNEFGLTFSTPIYETGTRAKILGELKEAGFDSGFKISSSVLGTQPICLPVTVHDTTQFFGLEHIKNRYDPKQVVRYYKIKKAIGIEYITDYFEDRGLEVEKVVQRLKKRKNRPTTAP